MCKAGFTDVMKVIDGVELWVCRPMTAAEMKEMKDSDDSARVVGIVLPCVLLGGGALLLAIFITVVWYISRDAFKHVQIVGNAAWRVCTI